MDKSNYELERNRIALLLKLGILGSLVILSGDMLMGWGVKDTTLPGLESQLSPYLEISDLRMILASIFGFAGVPLAVIGHYGIYKLLKPYSTKYARMYGFGNLSFLAFGGAGVHVSSVEAAYFYRNMMKADPTMAMDSTLHLAIYFLLPLYVIMIIGWIIMSYGHIRAITKGLSPYPRWFWIFSMPVGTLLFSLIGLFGNHALVNALMTGAFSLGNVWSLVGHLLMLPKEDDADDVMTF